MVCSCYENEMHNFKYFNRPIKKDESNNEKTAIQARANRQIDTAYFFYI